jgi:rod shape-determining protein MreB and related proteins
MSTKEKVLSVGIDLGTSQSAISTSAGARHVVDSYVGWPLDMVARKVIKKQVLIGDEALENRSLLDLHRPLEQGLIKEGSEKDIAAVKEILGHLIGLARDGDAERKVRAVVGVPAETLRVNKQQLRQVMKGMVDSLIIVSEPFAVAYGVEALLHTMIIDVGAGTTDFCVMKGRYPTEEDQRTLTKAGDSVDDLLAKLIADRHPQVQFSIHMVRGWKEKHGFVGESEERVEVHAPVHGKMQTVDVTDELRAACESLLAPFSETMLDLLAVVEPEYQERPRLADPGVGIRAREGAGGPRRGQDHARRGSRLRRSQRQPGHRARRRRRRLGEGLRLTGRPIAMPTEPGSPTDFQRSTRMPLDAVVRLHFEGTVAYQNGFAANVSASGMFVKHPDPPPVGTHLVFEFTIGSQRKPCQGTGEVVWVREKYEGPGRPAGSGIRFVDLDELSRQHLTEALFEFLEASLGDRVGDHPEVQAMVASMPTHAPIEADDTEESVEPFEPPAIEFAPAASEGSGSAPRELGTETVKIPVTTRDPVPGATPFRIFDDDVPLPEALAATAPPTPVAPPAPAAEQLPVLPAFESPAVPPYEPYRPESDETASIYGAAGVGRPSGRGRALGLSLTLLGLLAAAGGGWWYWTQYRPAQLAAAGAPPATVPAPAAGRMPAAPPKSAEPAAPPLDSRLGPGRTLVDSVGTTEPAPETPLPPVGAPAAAAASSRTAPTPAAASPTEAPAAAAPAPAASAPEPAPAIGAVRSSLVREIGAATAAGRTVVTIVGDGGFPTGSFSWSEIGGDRPRVLIRLKDIEQPYRSAARGVPTPEVAGIRAGYHLASSGNELHVVLDLVPSARARVESVEPSGDTLVVTLTRP